MSCPGLAQLWFDLRVSAVGVALSGDGGLGDEGDWVAPVGDVDELGGVDVVDVSAHGPIPACRRGRCG